MKSRGLSLFWTLLLCLSHLCHGIRDEYLRTLSDKCKQSLDSRQSYYSNSCFQYNALSNIHNLLAFGEELLQIGPIDLIYLKSIPAHLKRNTDDVPPVLVYPENSAEKVRTKKQSTKDDESAEPKSDMEQKIRNKKGNKKGHKKLVGRDRVRKSMTGNWTQHLESKRDVRPRTHPTEVDYYAERENKDDDKKNSEDGKKMDYFYSLEDTLNEDFKDNIDGGDYDEGETSEGLTNDPEEIMKIYRPNLIVNKPEEGNMIDMISNDADVLVTKSSDNIKMNRNRPKKVSATIGIRSNESGNERRFGVPAIVSLREVGIRTRVVPESRALLKNPEERQNFHLMRRKEESYFLNGEDSHEDLSSSSREDQAMENSQPSHNPLPLHHPVSKSSNINAHPLVAPRGPNMEHQLLSTNGPNMDHRLVSTSGPNMDHQLISTSGPNMDHRLVSTSGPNMDHQLIFTSDPNIDHQLATIASSNGDASEEPIEPRMDDQTRTTQDPSEGTSEEIDSNETREMGNRIDNQMKIGEHHNRNEKNSLGNSHHNTSNLKDSQNQSQTNVFYNDVSIENLQSGDVAKQSVYHQIESQNHSQPVNSRSQYDPSQHVDSHNQYDPSQHVDSLNAFPTSLKSIDTVVSTGWLSHLDEIAAQLTDIFSTYGITVPIPEWSEGLPAIIPLEEGKKGRDPSVSRRRTNKHSSTKKYMALFPLVAVLKFMVIKALLIPLLISVLVIKKIIILGVIAMPYVFSLLRVCRNGPGFGFLMGGGAGAGGGLGGNQVAANAPYLSAVDTAVDYTGGYGHAASYKDFGGGARWIDRHYPNAMAAGGKLGGEMGLMER